MITGEMTFNEAWGYFLEDKSQELAPKTLELYKFYFRSLSRFFGPMLLKDIRTEHVFKYRSGRVTAGPGLINHEVNAVLQMLEKAGLRADVAKNYKELRVPKSGPGQALLQAEALWLLEVASTKKRWQIAYLCSLLSANTSCGPGEIRHLRLRDVDLENHFISVVEGTKNDYRIRTIPLNADALWAAGELVKVALDKGSYMPDHYLLPKRPYRLGVDDKTTSGTHYDPTKPALSWKKAWYALRAKAGKRHPKLATLRSYDLRHHALTTLLEDPSISEQVIRDIAGHVSRKMIERYSHIRVQRKKQAVFALEGLRTTAPEIKTEVVVPKRRPSMEIEDPLEILQQANRR